ncbi:hypothetical protein SAMN05428954_6751 [Streptomyces sp. 2112.3]|uniref:hypothetical protein n=1 Tax=Streptomyces sp. 2112.3 TaxID=1881023 RepID=UPI000895F857|nr:hypothetical protein [Streptomyces sp. 2112.3]SEF13494.1 hypothetical protein SAMN05428954_6751 [Streptomyces sp. 2112.3]
MRKQILRATTVFALVTAVAAPVAVAAPAPAPKAASGTPATTLVSALKGKARLSYPVAEETSPGAGRPGPACPGQRPKAHPC